MLVKISIFSITLLLAIFVRILAPTQLWHFARSQPPYPPSPVVRNIHWDFYQLARHAPGSDLWPVTWGADDHLYTSWGDGGGFGGTNSAGRVSLGFARIEGEPESFEVVNLWGGKNSLAPARFDGKVAGLVSIEGLLYGWMGTETGRKLIWSEDDGLTWEQSSWEFSKSTFVPFSILNFGKDYAGARDSYVYSYGHEWGGAQDAYLVRVPIAQLRNCASYEFFAGAGADGEPVWSKDYAARKPVFSDPSGKDENMTPSVIYNPGIERYILTMSRGGPQKLGIFDAPEPWGPWTTVAYYENWGGFKGTEALLYSFPTKWISPDGKTMWMIFSSTGKLDSFNLVKADLILR